MHNYRLVVAYDGSRYKGWQRLGAGEDTIQAKIEAVLAKRLGRPVEVIGAGRTDAGVHALAQVANLKVPESLDCRELQAYLNRYLPDDIAVTDVAKAAEDFHARFHAVGKTYLYRIWNADPPNPFLRKYSLHVQAPLDVARMRRAAAAFVGEHDFTAYCNPRSKSATPVRTVASAEIRTEGALLEIRVRGDGFLHNMVRRMVGTLLEVGLGRIAPEDVPGILASKDRARTGPVAEAHGLALERVEFEERHGNRGRP